MHEKNKMVQKRTSVPRRSAGIQAGAATVDRTVFAAVTSLVERFATLMAKMRIALGQQGASPEKLSAIRAEFDALHAESRNVSGRVHDRVQQHRIRAVTKNAHTAAERLRQTIRDRRG